MIALARSYASHTGRGWWQAWSFSAACGRLGVAGRVRVWLFSSRLPWQIVSPSVELGTCVPTVLLTADPGCPLDSGNRPQYADLASWQWCCRLLRVFQFFRLFRVFLLFANQHADQVSDFLMACKSDRWSGSGLWLAGFDLLGRHAWFRSSCCSPDLTCYVSCLHALVEMSWSWS
jgi:hypothetical protein